ncbi:hypothetical protein ACJQWK_01704 [Exserohilum turcicum]|uniref:Uncharacterized protein n=1 Tax=Exserohilum turcicum (strain 28A) TaxID=671987 RepID=R0KK89_EXST2|nr:uncharacterized protein SETTUDRAFT_176510 [Exserohilum turcica Et28A]EOA88407.1 hypothetical protein SETTUDRAFT_176510 [Exserohilum turcica Et28A]
MASGNLKINAERLNATLQDTCTQYGALAAPSTGMCRLTLTPEDQAARDWLVAECKSLGCDVKIDQMGNIFAIRAGTANDKKPIGMGSHMDTQPAGGRYDGILGVQAGLEVLRTLHENNISTHCPVALINWTNEEGARFPGAMMASGVWSQHSSTPLSACWATRDSAGIALKDALQQTGYLGSTPCSHAENSLEAHFELHIEQGPLLEQAGKTIGVVESVQAMQWYSIRVSGTEAHSGTTPMADRADALVTASRLITAVRDTALSSGLGVATVGVITSDTASQATIPGGVTFIIDIRCLSDHLVSQLSTAIFTAFDAIIAQEQNHTTYTIQRTWGLPESKFHTTCIDAVHNAAVACVGEHHVMRIKSRAGHDSAWTSRVVPTCMIFVPSKGGVSHNPDEYTRPEHCAVGAQVLLDAVLGYDGVVARGE